MSQRLLPLETVRRLSGFGRARYYDGYVVQPKTVDEIKQVFDLARQTGRQIVLRGSGRSYGDAAVGAECIVLDIRGMDRVIAWHPQTGVIEVEGGVTLEQIWRHTLRDGYWLPVVSGTMFPTIAGALAANIHGKNNFKMGTLGEHVQEIEVLATDGRQLTLTPDDEAFYAIISGIGLLAVITRVKLKMKQVPSGDVRVHAVSCRNWDEQFATFERFHGTADYMVSWVDCFAKSGSAGRGIFHAANHAEVPNAEKTLHASHMELPPKIMGVFPKSQVWHILKLLNARPFMKLLNTAKHVAGKRFEHEKEHLQSLTGYSFLLDYVPNWELAYLPGGFIQYQSFVPREHAKRVFAEQVKMQQAEKLESYLGVLKQHRRDRFLLSHAVDGFSLALDFKVTSSNRDRLWGLCHRMNDLVLSAGGRFYFAKDSTLRSEDATAYLGEEALTRLRNLKRQFDPENLLTSELNRRLHLT